MEKKQIPVQPKAKALIFDCDGTLADTMAFHMEAWREAFAVFNESCPDEFLEPLKGMKEEVIVDLFNRQFNRQVDCRRLVEEKHKRYRDKLPRAKPVDPVVAVVKLYSDKLPMAVVSGGTRENVLLTLEIIGLQDHFDVILTADDKIKPKPSSDIFVEAAWQLKVHPRNCQVFEDGDIGIKAAQDVGMMVVDVRPYL